MSKIRVFQDENWEKVIKERVLLFEHEDGGALTLRQEIWEENVMKEKIKERQWYSAIIDFPTQIPVSNAPIYAELINRVVSFEKKSRKHWVKEGVLVD